MAKYNLMGRGSKSTVIPFNTEELKVNYTMNVGNMIFFYACEHLLSLAESRYGWGGGDYKNSKGIVIPMANQIGAHFDLLASGPKIDDIEIPIVALGLGAQFESDKVDVNLIPKGTVTWLKQLATKSKVRNISVRGKRTEAILHEMGIGASCIALGCPSLLINHSLDLGRKIKSKSTELINKGKLFNSISIAAGDPYHNNLELCSVERKLIDLINLYDGRYTVQNPLVLMSLSSGWINDIPKADLELVRKRWFIELDTTDMIDWFSNKSDMFFSAAQWIHNYQKKSLVVGTRIHGVQAAIQAGTPAICIYIDSRTKELCEMMNIPAISSEDFDRTENIEILFKDILSNWDGELFDSNRMKIAYKTKLFLESNGVDYNKGSILGRFKE